MRASRAQSGRGRGTLPVARVCAAEGTHHPILGKAGDAPWETGTALAKVVESRHSEKHPGAACFMLERTMNPGHFGVSETAIAIALANDNPGPVNYQTRRPEARKGVTALLP